MTRTTPPRPVDVVALYSELGPLARTATRLHPRRGIPAAAQSSIGGPLLWPAGEAWPVCPRTRHESYRGVHAGQSPLVPALQLYVRDVPGLPHPAGADLLQILWCPLDEVEAFEEPLLLWRDAASVDAPLDVSPDPHPEADGELIPRPCVIDPEEMTDYPYSDAPESLYERFREHDEPFIEEDREGWSMWDLLVMPGCKVGGYPSWTQPPNWPDCPKCGQGMHHLLTLSGDEGGRMWIPREEWATAGYSGGITEAAGGTEAAETNRHPLDMTFGDVGGFYVFYCPSCPDMPLASWFDCG
ncbi:DUF1963 domain-containing protein [Streptomyces sp. NPDC088350]|uniref:DUF1963 domain-containing protein n=1 Tax=Streptomyces sp. NPDC088350 TaxID=3365854 RepID=UPI003806A09F